MKIHSPFLLIFLARIPKGGGNIKIATVDSATLFRSEARDRARLQEHMFTLASEDKKRRME